MRVALGSGTAAHWGKQQTNIVELNPILRGKGNITVLNVSDFGRL